MNNGKLASWRARLATTTGALVVGLAMMHGGFAPRLAHASGAAEKHYATVLAETAEYNRMIDEVTRDVFGHELGSQKEAIARPMMRKLFTHPAMPAYVADVGAEWGDTPTRFEAGQAMEITVSILGLAGLHRLAAEHQFQFIEYMADMFQHASAKVCHELSERKRGATDALENSNRRRLGKDQFTRYIRLMEMSALAELDGTKPVALTPEQQQEAAAAFQRAAQGRLDLMDHDISKYLAMKLLEPIQEECMDVHSTYYVLLNLDEPHRTRAIQILLGNLN